MNYENRHETESVRPGGPRVYRYPSFSSDGGKPIEIAVKRYVTIIFGRTAGGRARQINNNNGKKRNEIHVYTYLFMFVLSLTVED